MGSLTARSSPALREREFHAWLARHLPSGRLGPLPLGDDAAALRPAPGTVAVLTTDSLVEGTHFLDASPPRQVGRAAVGVSLSDLAAKGARPSAVLLALIVPPRTPRAWAQALVEGAEERAEQYRAEIVGGDTKPGPVRTVVSTALGWARPDRLAPRTGARAGDVLVTTGVVGHGGMAAAGLSQARRARRAALSALLEVEPRVREGETLVRWADAMLDTSDGLAEAARLLSEASEVRVVVEEGRLPLAPGLARAARSTARRRALAFFGGDYELLAALPVRYFERARRAVASVRGRLTMIGRVERGRGAWLEGPDGIEPMPLAGWRPFDPSTRAVP